jgi:hypothetical protein
MKILSIACIVSLVTILQGCAVYTPSGSVVVDPHAASAPTGRGGFCPPGQAKKGNC